MAQFEILSGKSLKSAIAGRGAAIATFTQREHQLAVSALAHLDAHNDVIYVQALYDMSPANYKPSLRKWFVEFGKCGFKANDDGNGGAFTYSKSKASNIDEAMKIAPANFEKGGKEGGADGEAKDFDEAKYLEGVLKALEKKGGSARVIAAMEGVLKVARGPAVVVRNQKPAPQKEAAATVAAPAGGEAIAA